MKMDVKDLIQKGKIPLLIISIILIGFFCYSFFFKNEVIVNIKGKELTKDDYEFYISKAKDDTLEKFGFYARENYVIKEDADVRRTPNKAMYNSIYNLKFGTKIYTKNLDEESKIDTIREELLEGENRNNYVAIYADKPILLSAKPVGYISKLDIIEKSEFKNYKPKPKEVKAIEIESSIKSTIQSNLFLNEIQYNFPSSIDRFNKSIIYGDFNNDSEKDFAVILDNYDATQSVFQIYLYNSSTISYDLAYNKLYNILLNIKYIEKESDVILNSEITKSPIDGILILTTELQTYFYLFNTETKSFNIISN